MPTSQCGLAKAVTIRRCQASWTLALSKWEHRGRGLFVRNVSFGCAFAFSLGCSASPSPSLSPPPPPSPSPSAAIRSGSPTFDATPAPTPNRTESASFPPATSGPPAIAPGALTVDWAPDGRHLILRETQNGYTVIDLEGKENLRLNATYVEWVDASTVAAVGDGQNNDRTATLYDLNGSQAHTLTGEFEAWDFAPGHDLATARAIAVGDEAQGTKYKIWNGSTMSQWLAGVPVAWSPDGKQLAVLKPNGQAYRPGVAGTVSFVDTNGNETFALPNWISGSTEWQSFSPDGRYFATCLWNGSSDAAKFRVVDLRTSEVAIVVDGCGYYPYWSGEPRLYLSDTMTRPVQWTPNRGPSNTTFPAGSVAMASVNGDIALWSDPTLRLIHGDAVEDVPLTNITPQGWNPDGTQFAVTSDGLRILTPDWAGQTPSPSA